MALADKLTKIGTVTLPVYALGLRGAPNLARFNFFRFADCMAEVTADDLDADGNEVKIGSVGGVVGAHYLCHINRDNGHECEAELIIDVAEVWPAVLALFDSAEARQIITRLQGECSSKWEEEKMKHKETAEKREKEELESQLAELEQQEKELSDAQS